ncbi:unnamed protein product [Polarella glacialis]|uniref:Uncharacterized protein n=1 Tax=Polarella glacialis TaxID=89957 RepID=A0A813GWQ8_POLGL|nr:unnamed protein product [Polarella glacialis]
MIFDYVLVADDDSFINLPNALDLLNLLPKERVYVGNMIDTIPQRYDKEAGKIKLETSVSLYLGTPSKVPVFAHGMGFLISGDIAKLLADLGLSMKLRGNDDMLFGVWLRSIEYLYYLNYWPWFFDHEDFKGLFSRPCDVTAVVVHRMNAERWRTFDKQECHLCSPTLEPLDVQPGDEPPAPSSEKREPTDKGPKGLAVLGAGQEDQLQKCLSADKIGCSWPAPARAAAMKEELKNGEGACASRCLSEASGPNGTLPRNCPASLCFALCQPPGSDNSLCPSAPSRKRRVPTRGRPTLAICIFGSTWNDAQMRWHLRRSLESCSSQHLGVREGRVKHLFVMGSMPSKMDPLRAPAASELLRHRDIATIQLRNKSSESQSSYSQGWRLVEERFGGADFILFLDHRSFVNVPFILHKIIPELPTQSVIQGMMLDETFFGPCSLKDTGRCGYLMRRRAPTFPHGMGFLVSSDVAKFVSEMEARVPLRQADVPADVAFGMWVQTLEDVPLESDISHFHEFPDDSGISGEKVTELRRPLSGESTVVFPMSPEKWRQFFDAPTCTLTTGVFASSASQASMRASKATAGGSVVAQAKDEIDCWKGMGGRGEAWYLVCCDIGWAGCWGGDFTEALCCGSPPASPAREAGMPAETKVDGLDALGRFLGFDKEELQLLFFAMENATSFPTAPSASGPRFRCLTPTDCAKEAFARFYQGSWSAGFAPLRHPWQVDVQDHLFGLQIKLRTENDGGVPQGHEHTFERVQLANFFRRVQDRVRPEDMPASRRCLEWDSSAMGRHYFKKHCEVFDLVTYMGEGHTELREDPPGGRRNYFVDLHLADRVVPESSAGMVVCVQIFEHLRKPHVAMQQLFRLVDVGGYVVWSAPLFSEVHGAPQDYWRFTPSGAKVLAEDAGFEVLDLYSPGGLREVAGYLLGLTAPYWKKEAFLEDSASSWPLQVYMLLQKPKYA